MMYILGEFDENREKFDKREIRVTLFISYVTVLFDSMNNSLLNPVVPYLMSDLHATSFQEGLFFSIYSAMQLLSIFKDEW